MELSHTLEVQPNLYIRAFMKFYDLDRNNPNLNTCKLFWGTVGFFVLPFLLIVISPFLALGWLLGKLGDKLSERRNSRPAVYSLGHYEQREPKTKFKRSEFLDKFVHGASLIWFKLQKPVVWFFRFLLAVIVLAALAFLVYLLVTHIGGWDWASILTTIGWLLVGIVGAVVSMSLIYLVGYKLDERSKRRRLEGKRSVIKATFNSIHNHTCANIKVVSSESASK